MRFIWRRGAVDDKIEREQLLREIKELNNHIAAFTWAARI